MARPEFLVGLVDEKKVRQDYGGSNLEDLRNMADYYLACVTHEVMDREEEVYEDLMTQLVLRLMMYEELAKGEGDTYERQAYECLRDKYAAIFRIPEVVHQHLFTYCDDQFNDAVQRNDGARAKSWQEIIAAMGRLIKGETELDKEIAGEIEARKNDVTFLPEAWWRLRKEGRDPDEIGYDMCHVWR